MADLNKTEITLRITEAAATWLKGLGAKPVEVEVPIAVGWVADLAGVWRPTATEAIKAKLIEPKPRCPDWQGRTQNVIRIWQNKVAKWDQIFDRLPDPILIGHEVKISQADFRKDLRRKFVTKGNRTGPVHMRCLSVLRGKVRPEQYPDGWWVLEHGPSGRVVKIAQRGRFLKVEKSKQIIVLTSLSEKIWNREENKFWRDINRSHRDGQNKRISLLRVNRVVDAVLAVARGDENSIEKCLLKHLNQKTVDALSAEKLKQLDELYTILIENTDIPEY